LLDAKLLEDAVLCTIVVRFDKDSEKEIKFGNLRKNYNNQKKPIPTRWDTIISNNRTEN
jgi:hypothetical protein